MSKHARILRLVRDYAITAVAAAGAVYLTLSIVLTF